MPKRASRGRRLRAIHVATITVVVAVALGATAVFLVGSRQRRDDRKTYLTYESAVLAPIRTAGRVVQEEMKPSLGQLREGDLTAPVARDRAAAWRRVVGSVRADIVALDPPAFLGDVELRWIAAIDGYALISDLVERAASASGAERNRLLDEAADAGDHADDLFDRAAEVMQFHRRRLDLGPTSRLPDPTRRAKS